MSLPRVKGVEFFETKQNTQNLFDLIVLFVNNPTSDLLAQEIAGSGDGIFANTVKVLLNADNFEGKWLQSATTLCCGSITAKRIVIIGAGENARASIGRARHLGILAAQEAVKYKATTVSIGAIPAWVAEKSDYLEQLLLGINIGSYKYPKPNLSEKEQSDLEKAVTVTLSNDFVKNIGSNYLDKINALSSAITDCRLLQDGPPNVVTPKYVSAWAKSKAEQLKLKISILGTKELEELGFHAMLAVGNSSIHEPQFVVVDYNPPEAKNSLALVGKGVTFDSGGYCLKPSASQIEMKYDMCGAAITLASVFAIAQLKLPIRVYGIAALCENMIGTHAYRVGDVITGYSGKSIEILNTDAEGRVVLSDALSYTAKVLQPNYMIDFATLTGSMVRALGSYGAGLFSFSQPLHNLVMQAAQQSGERLWPMPTEWDEMAEEIKSTIADVRNIQKSGDVAPGSVTASFFLNEFSGGVPFAHIDIAGVVTQNQSTGYPKDTSSGYGVQLAIMLAQVICDNKSGN